MWFSIYLSKSKSINILWGKKISSFWKSMRKCKKKMLRFSGIQIVLTSYIICFLSLKFSTVILLLEWLVIFSYIMKIIKFRAFYLLLLFGKLHKNTKHWMTCSLLKGKKIMTARRRFIFFISYKELKTQFQNLLNPF